MPLLVVFVTGSGDVIDVVNERHSSLVPVDLRGNAFAALGGEEVSVSGFRVEPGCTYQVFLDHLQSLDLGRASGVVVLTDDALAGLVALLGDVFSVNRFAAPGYGQNVVNLLQAVLSKALRTFRVYKNRFDDLKYQQVLRLPLRNFDAPEIGELQTACRDMMNRANFGQEFEAVLKRLRGRQRPKKAQFAPVTYLVDNAAKHFTLGHELHAQAETTIPPHNELCILGNAFRFGRAFDGRRHFNVSRDGGGSMVGQYPDCHKTVRAHPTASHVNMFTNDYF
jgi:hypothetical protein